MAISPKTTLRSRIASAIRGIALAAILAGAVIGAVATMTENGWVFVVTGAAVTAIVVWIIADDRASSTLSDLDNAISAMQAFAMGDKSSRVRGVGARDIRAIADSFNKIANENANALSRITTEDKRQLQFVSDVSHEFRSPLAGIRGTAELLLMGDIPREDQMRFLSTIVRESDRLSRLASDILTLESIEGATGELPLRRFNPREAVDRAAETLDALFDLQGVSFHVVGAAPDILGDIDRIQQVITNLVDNATRMVNDGGKVWVELAKASRADLGSRVITRNYYDVEEFAVISVCDNGPGVPEKEIPSLFERFHRTDASRDRNTGGAGLGLAIVKAIVDAHGGEIEVKNLLVGGAQFTVYLPTIPEDVGGARF